MSINHATNLGALTGRCKKTRGDEPSTPARPSAADRSSVSILRKVRSAEFPCKPCGGGPLRGRARPKASSRPGCGRPGWLPTRVFLDLHFLPPPASPDSGIWSCSRRQENQTQQHPRGQPARPTLPLASRVINNTRLLSRNKPSNNADCDI